jgi:serine/threonine protein kinase
LVTDTGQIKLGDFGLSESTALPNEPRCAGTIAYAAPEVFVSPDKVGTPADIWSFGVLLFAMFVECRQRIWHRRRPTSQSVVVKMNNFPKNLFRNRPNRRGDRPAAQTVQTIVQQGKRIG